MTEPGLWEWGSCSECSGRAKRVPDSAYNTWTHDGKACSDSPRARFIPGTPAPPNVIDLRDPVAVEDAIERREGGWSA